MGKNLSVAPWQLQGAQFDFHTAKMSKGSSLPHEKLYCAVVIEEVHKFNMRGNTDASKEKDN